MTISIGKWRGLQRISDGNGCFMMLAADQRPPIKNVIAKHFSDGVAPYDEVARFKRLLVKSLQSNASAVLLDPYYCLSGALIDLDATRGLIVTLEDSIFRETLGGRLSSTIPDWSVEKIKSMGADAVKVLAWYRPDASADVLDHQRRFVQKIGDDCRRFDIPYLLELLVYPLAGEQEAGKGYEEMAGKKAQHVIDSVREFADPRYRVDIFKLESPINSSDIADANTGNSDTATSLFSELDRIAGRPWVMLSAGASATQFELVLELAIASGASGFLAGRAIWQKAFSRYPNWAEIDQALRDESLPYLRKLSELTASSANGQASIRAVDRLQSELALLKDSALRNYAPGTG